MDFEQLYIGVDIEEVSRFTDKSAYKDKAFLDKIFTNSELEYCFSKKLYAQHLAARYCAKEAVVKALYPAGIKDVYYKDIEIVNNKDGCPKIKIKKYPDLKAKISLSHTKAEAIAYVMVYVC